jgi:hypothetical protein
MPAHLGKRGTNKIAADALNAAEEDVRLWSKSVGADGDECFSESGCIHYIAAHADGIERRLSVDEDHPLCSVLDSHLLAQGYTGPASATEAERRHRMGSASTSRIRC